MQLFVVVALFFDTSATVDLAQETLRELQELPVWQERDTCLGKAIQSMHDRSWFSTEGLPKYRCLSSAPWSSEEEGSIV